MWFLGRTAQRREFSKRTGKKTTEKHFSRSGAAAPRRPTASVALASPAAPLRRCVRKLLLSRPVVHTPHFMHLPIVEPALDDLVAEQRKHPPAEKQRPRIPIPIKTRRPAPIVDRLLRLRSELTDFAELQRIISQKYDRGGVVKQLLF